MAIIQIIKTIKCKKSRVNFLSKKASISGNNGEKYKIVFDTKRPHLLVMIALKVVNFSMFSFFSGDLLKDLVRLAVKFSFMVFSETLTNKKGSPLIQTSDLLHVNQFFFHSATVHTQI